MDILINKESILHRLETLSSYEGRDAVSPDGQSLFEDILTTEQDEDWLVDYLKSDSKTLYTRLSPSVSYISVLTSGDVIFNVSIPDVRINIVKDTLIDALVYGVLSKWMSNHKPERVELYTDLFVTSITNAINVICNVRPKKNRRPSPLAKSTISVIQS